MFIGSGLPTARGRGFRASQRRVHVIIPHSVIDMLYQSTIAILLLVGSSRSRRSVGGGQPQRDIKRGCDRLLIQAEWLSVRVTSPELAIGGASLTTGRARPFAHGYAGCLIDAHRHQCQASEPYLATRADARGSGRFTVLLALVGTALAQPHTAVAHHLRLSKDKRMPAVSLAPRPICRPYGGVWSSPRVGGARRFFGPILTGGQPDQLHGIQPGTSSATRYLWHCLVAFASRHRSPFGQAHLLSRRWVWPEPVGGRRGLHRRPGSGTTRVTP